MSNAKRSNGHPKKQANNQSTEKDAREDGKNRPTNEGKPVRTMNLGSQKRYDPTPVKSDNNEETPESAEANDQEIVVDASNQEGESERSETEDQDENTAFDDLLLNEDQEIIDQSLVLEEPPTDEKVETLNHGEEGTEDVAIHSPKQADVDESDDIALEKTREFNQEELAAARLLDKETELGETKEATRERLKQPQAGETDNEEANTREQRRKALEKEKGKFKARLIPIWLRLVILIVLALIALSVGAMIGYGVIGKGHPMDVFHVDTWKHIKDLVTEGT